MENKLHPLFHMLLIDFLRIDRSAASTLFNDKNPHLGKNIEIVKFSGIIVTESEQKVKFTNELFAINSTFNLDAQYQVECYLIRRYKAKKLINIVVTDVRGETLQT